MKCTHCGKEHSEDFKVCPYTAKPIETQLQYCKNEGCNFRSPLPLSAKFCPNCGQVLQKEGLQTNYPKEFEEYRFDEIRSFIDGFAVVKKGKMFGLISSKGDLMLECHYKSILPFSEGLCGVCDESDQWIFLNHNLERVLELSPDYYVTSDKGFNDGLCAVFKWDDDKEDYLYGYINIKGEEVITCEYNYADDFESQHAIVSIDDFQYVINLNGQLESHGWDQIRLRGKYAICNDFLNRDYTEIVNLYSGEIIPLGRGLNVHVIGELKNNICCYFKQNKLVWFDINNPNNRLSFKQPIKNWWGDFSEGMMSVSLKSDGLYGFIDQNGNNTIPFIYSCAHNFRERLAAICIDSKWNYIDKNGDVVIDGNYDNADDFNEGLAVVIKNGKPFVIDKTGKVVIK